MSHKLSFLALAPAMALAFLPSDALAWGGCRSVSAGGWRGNVTHTGTTSGGWGGWSHSGTTTATGRYGNTYTAHHSGAGNYYGGGYHAGGYGAYRYGGYYGGGYGAGVVTGAVVGAAAASAAYYNSDEPGVYYARPAW